MIITRTNRNNSTAGNLVDYYFIKPFEVVSSYNDFINTWKIANSCNVDCDEVSNIQLLQSYSGDFHYGFVSFSKWKSKESFIKSNRENSVLRYHNFVGDSVNSFYTNNLYKLNSEINLSDTSLSKAEIQILYFESLSTNDDDVKNFWGLICNEIKYKKNVHSAQLFKSVYKIAKFRYIGFIHQQNSSSNELGLLHEKLLTDKVNSGFIINTSLYSTIKRINKNTKKIKQITL